MEEDQNIQSSIKYSYNSDESYSFDGEYISNKHSNEKLKVIVDMDRYLWENFSNSTAVNQDNDSEEELQIDKSGN